MLPPGVYSVTQIEQEKNPVSQVIQLVSLLEFLLNFVNPNQLGKEGKPATVGERVDANRALFANPPDVFFGIGVRNNIVHAKASDVTDAEIKRAVSHLLNAVKEIRQHPNLPQSVRLEVFASAAEMASAPTRAVTTSQLPPAPPAPNFNSANQSAPTSSRPLTQTAAVNSSPSYTTKVTPRPTMTPQQPEHKVSTNTIRNIAIALALLAAVLFLAKPAWHLIHEKLYGSEEETRITRTQAESALKTIRRSYGNKPVFAAKVIEADSAWRDAEIAFNQGKFKEAEPLYRRVLGVGDELALKETERKDAQQFFDEMKKARDAANAAQAPQYATGVWQEAENLRRLAETALKNGDSATAKQNALQAQQKYEEAKIAADATPKPEPSPTPVPVTPPNPEAGNSDARVRPRPESD
ncbi:MAG: hypothetical protein JNK38_09070 [Acidobacteria bacterium]|nr:hypothetical protein [Acidobacteriota bacterium]